jgi:cellulose synthase/poly-beta-1,6-N-acetylglucosamine synthase-like glycosyltransferase
VPFAVLLIALCREVVPWLENRRSLGYDVFLLSLVSAALWLVVLWWALHHLTFQLAALCPRTIAPPPPAADRPPRFMVLYLTCDDFIPECCLSCVKQDYPADSFQLAVCDDSETAVYRTEVDRFCAAHGNVILLRRNHCSGHKAGNLNHAFAAVAEGKCDWVVIVDADQMLPSSYLRELAPFVTAAPAEVAFVQAGRDLLPSRASASAERSSPASAPPGAGVAGRQDGPLPCTPFQTALQMEIRLFSERDMDWRREFGFLPFLGHGGAIREEAWKKVGGFPAVVSEDYAFTMAAREQGYWGERVEQVRSWDGYPRDFDAFVVRISKFAGGAAELFRKSFPCFLRSQATLVEKVDAFWLLATYFLMPLSLINLLLSTYLCHIFWSEGLVVLPPLLAYLFLGMLLFSFPVLISVNPVVVHGLRHWFWAFAVYGAVMPIAAAHFLRNLFRAPPFRRTPKGVTSTPALRLASILTSAAGLAGLWLAWRWWSPFSPVLLASALAQACFPLYRWLHEDPSWRGRLSRTLVYGPGVLFIWGLLGMWFWATN